MERSLTPLLSTLGSAFDFSVSSDLFLPCPQAQAPSSGSAMLRGALSLQVDPEPICSFSATTKNTQPIHPVRMKERLEVKELRSVLRDRMIPAAFPHLHAAMHTTKLSSPGPRAGESCSLLGVSLQGAEMRHLGVLLGQMIWEVSIRWCR